MKIALSTLFLTFLCLPFISAQVLECTQTMTGGTQSALAIELPGADSKMVETIWKEYMKPYGKVAKVKGGKESVASDVQILDIGGVNRIKVYSLTEAVGDGSKMIVWFDMGNGYVNSTAYPKEYVAGVNFLKDFAHEVKIEQIAKELEEQKKLLSKAESDLSKLKRENDSLHKIIEDSKKRIAAAEKDIETNLKDQEVAQKEIGAQNTTVSTVEKKLEDAKKEQK
ncbi:MAG: hypothetical protein ABIQ11_06115 [Saprospiraceae bacterium]